MAGSMKVNAQKVATVPFSDLLIEQPDDTTISVRSKTHGKLKPGAYRSEIVKRQTEVMEFFINQDGVIDRYLHYYTAGDSLMRTQFYINNGAITAEVEYHHGTDVIKDTVFYAMASAPVFDKDAKAWKEVPKRVKHEIRFFVNGDTEINLLENNLVLKTVTYHGEKLLSEYAVSNYTKNYKKGRLIEHQFYDWKTNEEVKNIYDSNGNLKSVLKEYDSKLTFNLDGTKTYNTDGKAGKSYSVLTEYFPDGKIRRTREQSSESDHSLIKIYSPSGKLLKTEKLPAGSKDAGVTPN